MSEHPWCKSLAQNLSTVRHLKGISLRAHAKQLGMSPATLSRVERGWPCDLRVLAKICQGTGLPVDVLLGVGKVKARKRSGGET